MKMSKIGFVTTVLACLAAGAGCAPAEDDEAVGTMDDEVVTGANTRLGLSAPTPPGLPGQVKIAVAPANCPKVTDCNATTTARLAEQALVFQPDVIVVTELFYDGAFNNFIKSFDARTGGKWFYARGPEQDAVIGATGGVVVLSKYPFAKKLEHELDACSDPDCHAAKGIVLGQLRIGTDVGGAPVTLDVAGLHLQAKTILGNYTKTQSAQIDEMRGFLGRKDAWGDTGFGKGDPTLKVIAGDFNFSATGPSWLADGLLSTQGAVEEGKRNWRKLVDVILAPNRMSAGRVQCPEARTGTREAADRCAQANTIRYNDDGGDVVKQLYTSWGYTTNRDGVSKTTMVPVRYQETVALFTKIVPGQPSLGVARTSRPPYKVGDRLDNGTVVAITQLGGGFGSSRTDWAVTIRPDVSADQALQIVSDHPTHAITYRLWNAQERTSARERRDAGGGGPAPHEEG